MDDVIDGTMTIVVPFTLLTAETMGSPLVHIGSTMLVDVGTAPFQRQLGTAALFQNLEQLFCLLKLGMLAD